MKKRRWSIRARFIALMTTPIVSLIAMWLFATNLTFSSASGILSIQTNYSKITKPTDTLVTELQRERRLTLVFLGSTRVDGNALAWQRVDTDTTIAAFREQVTSGAARDVENAGTRKRIDQTLQELDRLVTVRQTVDQRQADRTVVLRMYTTVIERAFQIYPALPDITERNIGKDSRTIIALSRAREVLSEEDALLNGAAATGRFTGAEPAQLAALIGAQRAFFNDAAARLPTSDQNSYEGMSRSEAATRLRAMEEKLLSDARAGSAIPIDMSTWQTTYDSVVTQLRTAETAAHDAVMKRSHPLGVNIMVRLGLATALGLIAVIVSLVASVRMGHDLIARLIRLDRTANRLATERLPVVLRQLREGEEVDVDAESQPLDFGTDEIGMVGQAFGTVERVAIESAVNEARLRSGVNKVFLNIARRSQTLLHRQLSLLDAMERQTVDPAKLQELFQLDHLATRMRRHSEDLVILAGAAPARGWRNPIPLIDVVRGSISEVEDYARITLQTLPEISLAGPVVSDVTHLLSELLENASAFSPPHTPVLVGGQLVPSGLAIDIEDRGLGMPPEAIEEANERLAHPPEFDPANSARLGLFVVAALAVRHNITVGLRRSAYGGVTAVVLIPPNLIAETPPMVLPPTPDPKPAGLRALTRVGGTAVPSISGRLAPRQGRNRPGGRGGRPEQNTAAQDAETTVEIPASQLEVGTEPPPAATGPTRPAQGASSPAQLNGLTEEGLPRRRRQASLAPQLRKVPEEIPPRGDWSQPSDPGADASAPDTARRRSPEQARSMMSAFQSGTLRGRKDASLISGEISPPQTPASPDNADEKSDSQVATDQATTGAAAAQAGPCEEERR